VGEKRVRLDEWYVPKFGPLRFRAFVGMTFFPYTSMNASYPVIGSLLAETVHYDRMAGMALVYAIAVGISAHSLDAMAPNKPWGSYLSRRQLFGLAALGLVLSLGLGLYYALAYALLLIPLGLIELFFLFAYNLEMFGGAFHTDLWFALSWGYLPILAGYVVQTNQLGAVPLLAGFFGFFTAYAEINASRPYKVLKKDTAHDAQKLASRFESILKGMVSTVLSAAVFLLVYRLLG
jgi:hypothetical protein